MKSFWLSMIVLFLLLAEGCSLSLSEEPTTSGPGQQNPTADANSTLDETNASPANLPERVPPTEATMPVTGEVPTDLLNSILNDLTGKVGAAPDNITVIRAQAVVWNDGSLGCGKPGEFYTQALVNGYWVVLEVEGKTYDYRATDKGYFFQCEGGNPPNPSSGTPSS